MCVYVSVYIYIYIYTCVITISTMCYLNDCYYDYGFTKTLDFTYDIDVMLL